MKIYSAQGEPVLKFEQWPRPKKPVLHWQPGRSAMEFARIWFREGKPEVPDEYRASLNRAFPRLCCLEVYPEHVTSLPESGEGRNHDALLLMTSDVGTAVIGVEAKADEPFGKNGESVGEYRRRMLALRRAGESTRVPERIEALLTIVGSSVSTTAHTWDEVPYQLLAAAAGVLIEARERNAAAVLLIHEFVSAKLNDSKRRRNHEGIRALRNAVFQTADCDGVHGPVVLGKTPFYFLSIETPGFKSQVQQLAFAPC